METVIVAFVVFAALAYVGRRLWATLRPKPASAAGCGDGCGCGTDAGGAGDWAQS